MLSNILKYIKQHELFNDEDKLLVTVSGGKDSVFLLHALYDLGFSLAVAHCNFGLRGEESDGDEQFVKALAEKYQIEFYTKKFETKAYASENGISIQMAARELRYKWFESKREQKQFDYIVTAHHLNDNIETAVYNFINGTGVAGIRGILPKINFVRRPLLAVSRHEIDQYVAEKKIDWREDSSNASDNYTRNKIRRYIIPKMEEINAGLLSSFELTSKKFISAERVINAVLGDFENKIKEENGHYFLPLTLVDDTEFVILIEYFKKFNFTPRQTEEILRMAKSSQVGSFIQSEEWKINLDRASLIISKRLESQNTSKFISINDEYARCREMNLSFKVKNDLSLPNKQGIEKLDYGKLSFPLEIRQWQEGDVFQPLGMEGTKKVSDFLIDEKIPLNLKSNIFVLISDNKIACILGHRVDDRFKLTENSELAYQIEISND